MFEAFGGAPRCAIMSRAINMSDVIKLESIVSIKQSFESMVRRAGTNHFQFSLQAESSNYHISNMDFALQIPLMRGLAKTQ